MSGSLDRERLLGLFGDLAEKLRRRGIRGHVYIVGGAAMTLAFRRERTTKDVDAHIGNRGIEHAGIMEAVREIAAEQGLAENWLNELATMFTPRGEDPRAPTLFDSPHLVVTGASAEHLLAMKLHAGRVADRKDIETLVRHLGIRTTDEALRHHARLFPETPASGRARVYVEEAIRRASAGP